jgi:hypothetical protein
MHILYALHLFSAKELMEKFFEEKITKTHILYALYTFVRYIRKQLHHHQEHIAASLAHKLKDAHTGYVYL